MEGSSNMPNTRKGGAKRLVLVSLPLVAAGLIGAASASAAAPQNTSAPAISGTARDASTLAAADGSWSNTPTSFTYQWQRCANDATACGDITGATSKTYVLVTGDVGHTVRVVVTAVNTDGKTPALSQPTDVVDSKNGPTSSVKPAVSGSTVVGGSLAVSNGSWTPSSSSFTRQWQRCAKDGTGCLDIAGATGKTYGVRSADVDFRLRALVTAHTAAGQATAASNASAVITQTTVTTTQTTTTIITTPAPKAPTVRILSLKRVGKRVYARFRVCAPAPGAVKLTERDQKARALPYTRHLAVRVGTCGTFSKHWLLLARFRKHGRLLVTMRAAKNGQLSHLAGRSIVIR
jgi:hypothetical protein